MTQSIHNGYVSALTVAKHGKDKAALLSILTNVWELTQEQMDDIGLLEYYLRKWSGQYLRDSIHQGTLTDDTNTYAVIYRNCTPAIAFNSSQVRVSFRASRIGCFAIVQPAI